MPDRDMPDAQQRLRDTAENFMRARGALQSSLALAVVNASPVARKRVDALNIRAAKIQRAIETTGAMVDGARRWFADTFGTDVEESVPLANPAIDASVQSSIAAMNYFLRDANAELQRIAERQKTYDTVPAEKKDFVLSELRAEETPAPGAMSKKWALIGLAIVGAVVWLKGGNHES